jgi:N-carbamoylputrescine amidase
MRRMARALTVAVTETINVYPGMPERVEELHRLEGKLEDVRRANVEHHLQLIERASARGVSIIGLGELFPAPYFAINKNAMWHVLAESAEDGPTIRALCAAAAKRSIAIVAPIYERDEKLNARFNTAVVIGPGGRVLGKYRKTHIPQGKNEQGEFNEPFYFGPAAGMSDYFPVFELPGARVGVTICYDRHFEGVVRSLAAKGAELIFSPAVTFGAKSERMWEMEFEVDAARHNVFIAGSNRKGSERPWNQPFFGKSYVVGPNGRAEPDRSEPGLVIATIDLEHLAGRDPSGWNLVRDRRPEIYVP